MKWKRPLAMAGVILILAMYVIAIFLQKSVRQKLADGGSLLDCRHTGYFICFSAGIQALKP